MSNASQHAMTNDTSLRRYEHLYIDGTWVKPIDGELAESIDPATGRPWAIVPMGGPQDIDRAVAAARRIQRPVAPCRDTNARRCYAASRSASALRFPNWRSSSRGITAISCASIASLAAQVQWYQWFASLADKAQGTTIPIDDSVHAFTTRVPIGVVGAIIPWNAPLLATCLKIGAALAAARSSSSRPSKRPCRRSSRAPDPRSRLSARRVQRGARLWAHGRRASGQASGRRQDLVYGREPDRQTDGSRRRRQPEALHVRTRRQGAAYPVRGRRPRQRDQRRHRIRVAADRQSCALGSRVLVERSIYERVVDAFCARAKSVRVGMPSIDTNHMGQSHQAQLDKTLSYIEIGKQDGAELVAGGHRIATPGRGRLLRWPPYSPASRTGCASRATRFSARWPRLFHSTAKTRPSRSPTTPYGLTAGLWTRDVGRAHRVSGRIDAGMVWVNTYSFLRWSTPYGGFKASGWGRKTDRRA